MVIVFFWVCVRFLAGGWWKKVLIYIHSTLPTNLNMEIEGVYTVSFYISSVIHMSPLLQFTNTGYPTKQQDFARS